MSKTYTEIAVEMRKQFDAMKEELEANNFCIRRECMCDMAAPVVKLEAALVELEQKGDPYVEEPAHQRMGL